MINRDIILSCAEAAGFGGHTRASMLPRLIKFAAHIATEQRRIDAQICWNKGKSFDTDTSEFCDGQMDGAYQCADLIEGNNAKESRSV
jgi:hypothetical protein